MPGTLPTLSSGPGWGVGISVSPQSRGPGRAGFLCAPSHPQGPGIESGLMSIRRPGCSDHSDPSASQSPGALRFHRGASPSDCALSRGPHGHQPGGRRRCPLIPGLGVQGVTWQLPGKLVPALPLPWAFVGGGGNVLRQIVFTRLSP